MDKKDFVLRVIQKFTSESSSQKDLFIEDNLNILPNNANYEQVYNTFLREYNFSKPPSTATLLAMAKKHIKTTSEKEVHYNTLYAYVNETTKFEFAYPSTISYKEACYELQKQKSKINILGEIEKAFIKFEKKEEIGGLKC